MDDFDTVVEKPSEPTKLELEFERFYHNTLPHIDEGQARELVARIGTLELMTVDFDKVEYGANYDIREEIQSLISAVRAMRGTVMDEHGQIKQGVSAKDLKETITSMTSLMNLLMKSHKEVMTFDRHRALEQATIDTLKEMGGEEIVTAFVENMTARLEND